MVNAVCGCNVFQITGTGGDQGTREWAARSSHVVMEYHFGGSEELVQLEPGLSKKQLRII